MSKKYNRLLSRVLKLLFALILVSYLGVCVFYYFYQESLLFPSEYVPKESPDALKKYVKSYDVDGMSINGWSVIYSKQKPTIFYYGGNREIIHKAFDNYKRHYGKEFNFISFEYPGYGMSTGQSSEKNFIKAMSHVTEKELAVNNLSFNKTVFVGRSIGSSVATQLAEKYSPAGVVLITPFDSILNLGHARYPFLPLKTLLRHPFDSQAAARNIDTPVLVIEAENDTLVPVVHAENLAASWKGPVRKLFLHEGTHNNPYRYPAVWQQMRQFILQVTRSKS